MIRIIIIMGDMRPILKMAANSPRWPTKQCQTIFVQNIQPISEKNHVWQESTKIFTTSEKMTQQHTLI